MTKTRRALTGVYADLVLAGTGYIVSAGDLNPPPGPVAPTMVTLDTLETKLDQILAELGSGFDAEASSGIGPRIFLTADGIQGGSQDFQGFEGSVELESASISIDGDDVMNGQIPIRRLEVVEFDFVVDRALTSLMQRQTTGMSLRNVRIQWCLFPGAMNEQCYLEILMQDAFITSSSQQINADDVPMVNIQMRPIGQVTLVYRRFDPQTGQLIETVQDSAPAN